MHTETTQPSDAFPTARHAHWLLRLGLASVFIYMGIDKFMGVMVISGVWKQAERIAYPVG